MSNQQRREQFQDILERFNHLPLTVKNEKKAVERMQQFIVCYLGLCFIEGYRILQKIGNNVFILSLMQYQHTSDHLEAGCKRLHGMYKIVYVDFKEDLNQNSQLRLKIFADLLQTIHYLKDNQQKSSENCLEVHFIFAYNHKYAVVDQKFLIKGKAIDLKDFYRRDSGNLKEKYAVRLLDQRSQGTKLHEFVQLFLKGSGIFRNPKHLQKQTLQGCRFNYNLDSLLNTLCLIIGKQFLQNAYMTLTSQKWMRRSTMKKFKRFDLLLRNEDKVCIIDWKFSKTQANEKIATKSFSIKNKQYFQLARKEYNAFVQLKFYCFHQRQQGNFHRFTSAQYDYQQQEVQIDKESEQQREQDIISNQSIQIQQFADAQVNIDKSILASQKKVDLITKNKKNENENIGNVLLDSFIFQPRSPQHLFIPRKTINILQRINHPNLITSQDKQSRRDEQKKSSSSQLIRANILPARKQHKTVNKQQIPVQIYEQYQSDEIMIIDQNVFQSSSVLNTRQNKNTKQSKQKLPKQSVNILDISQGQSMAQQKPISLLPNQQYLAMDVDVIEID